MKNNEGKNIKAMKTGEVNTIACPKCKNNVFYRLLGQEYRFACSICKFPVGKKHNKRETVIDVTHEFVGKPVISRVIDFIFTGKY